MIWQNGKIIINIKILSIENINKYTNPKHKIKNTAS